MQGRVQDTTVVEVTDADFVDMVVEGSKRRPVVVDLWAAWCGPCRTLGPLLEKVAHERQGAFLLAKLDVDANPSTASRFGVQSIPTVFAFVDGKPVDGFVGAIPEPMINRFIDGVLPTEADRAAEEAAEDEAAGEIADAERRYREALAQDDGNRTARLGLGRILAERGESDEARRTLMPLVPDDDADRLLAKLDLADWSGIEGPGTLASAKRLAARGRWREALDGMLGALGDDPDARGAMLTVFSAIGEDDPIVAEYRRKLASALF